MVRLDIKDEAFEAGSTKLKPRWDKGIGSLITTLEQRQSVLRLSYVNSRVGRALALRRLRELEKLISQRWDDSGGGYRLEIETRLERGQ